MGFSANLILTIIMSIVFVAGIALIVPTLISFVGQLGGENKGVVTSLYTFIIFVGASLGPIVATYIMRFGNPTLPFTIFGCTFLVSLFLSIYLNTITKRTKKVNVVVPLEADSISLKR
jgi:MFS family permease